jgi:ribosomal protein S18 acetylase RimI-like enzyme
MVFKVREARRSDKEPLMSFIKYVWGGTDYIPHVWDDWIRDRSAKMFVIETDGKPIAMNRVRFPEDGSAWFEGVRVHPQYRRLGLASMLGENAMKVASDRGSTIFRLTSGSRNKASHGQVAKMGFREVSRFSVYQADPAMRFRSHREARVAREQDLDLVRNLIEESREFRLGQGVLWDGFVALSLTPSVLRGRLRGKSVYVTGDAVAIHLPGREGRETWNQIGYISGEPDSAVKLVDSIFAMKGKFSWKLAMVPQRSPLIRAFREHGLTRSFANVLFERRAAKG